MGVLGFEGAAMRCSSGWVFLGKRGLQEDARQGGCFGVWGWCKKLLLEWVFLGMRMRQGSALQGGCFGE